MRPLYFQGTRRPPIGPTTFSADHPGNASGRRSHITTDRQLMDLLRQCDRISSCIVTGQLGAKATPDNKAKMIEALRKAIEKTEELDLMLRAEIRRVKGTI